MDGNDGDTNDSQHQQPSWAQKNNAADMARLNTGREWRNLLHVFMQKVYTK